MDFLFVDNLCGAVRFVNVDKDKIEIFKFINSEGYFIFWFGTFGRYICQDYQTEIVLNKKYLFLL